MTSSIIQYGEGDWKGVFLFTRLGRQVVKKDDELYIKASRYQNEFLIIMQIFKTISLSDELHEAVHVIGNITYKTLGT